MRSETGKKGINYLSVCFVIILMTGLAELFSEREIIFPEIAALAIGSLAAPKRSWQVNRSRMVLLIAVCASLGIMIVRVSDAVVWLQILIAFSVCQIIYLYSGTTFAPLISASALPVLLQTESWIYPVSATVFTILICMIQAVNERLGLRTYETFTPMPRPDKYNIRDAVIRIICVGTAAAPALIAGWRFCVAPPLLVAFTELSRKASPARKRPIRVVVLITLCAVSGTVARLILSAEAGLPLAASAAAASVIMLLLVDKMNLYLPPAGAMAILPMLLQESELVMYPIQVFIGITVLTAAALILFHESPSHTEKTSC